MSAETTPYFCSRCHLPAAAHNDGRCRPDTIGARVASLRQIRGLNYRQLAERAGQVASTIHRLEHDRTADPGVWLLSDVAAALDVSLSTLVSGAHRVVGRRATTTEHEH